MSFKIFLLTIAKFLSRKVVSIYPPASIVGERPHVHNLEIRQVRNQGCFRGAVLLFYVLRVVASFT